MQQWVEAGIGGQQGDDAGQGKLLKEDFLDVRASMYTIWAFRGCYLDEALPKWTSVISP